MVELTHTELLDRLFAGNGEMAQLMRSHDWAKTPLGPVETWPQSLRSTVSILLNSRYPMFTFWGPQLVKLYNDAYRPVLGATKHPSALGRPAPEIWPDIWDAIGPLVDQVIIRGEATWSDNMLLLMYRSGYTEETYFTFSYSPVRDETGGIGGLFCACTETTQQVLGERRLRTLRDLAAQAGEAKTAEAACQITAKTLANNAADIPFALIYLLDSDGKHAHLTGITGMEPGTPASPTTIDLSQLPDPEQTHGWALATVVQTNQVKRVDDVIEQLGKVNIGPWEESPHTALIIPIASPGQDRPTGLLVAGISARRALDDDYQGFLELVAGQIATAITDARAYEAERERAEALEEIDRTKTVFFSNVSHEFRTPLTLMLAPIEDSLADLTTPLPPIHRERIEIVQRNSLRLLKLVNTLLDFSRIEAGRIEAVYEPTDLATLTAELASTFRSLIERAGMALVVDCPPLQELVYVDREMWEKIVLNLLSNAFKFTFTGTITVRLHLVQDQTGEHVELGVEDTGIGVPPDEIPHLFERFHRVKGAQGRSFEGSGIGLSLVQELVKLHSGSITLTSTVGQGSCFTVSIPLGVTHLPPDRIRATRTLTSTAMGATPFVEEAWRWLPEESGSTEEAEIGRVGASSLTPPPHTPPLPATARILIVDDNTDMREYVKRLLGQRYEVETAEDGIVALNKIHQCIPDLVLTDVMMPHLDGFGLLKELRANPQTRELPIILLSARAGEESRLEGLEAGADDYLIKPFSSRELIARIEASLKMAQIRQEAALQEQALRLAAEQSKQDMVEALARLTNLLETMSDAFIALDQDWRITYQNAAAEQINHGKPRSEVLGKTHWEAWPSTVGTELEYQYQCAIAEQVPVHFEYHYVAPPEFDIWVEMHVYPSEEGLGVFFRDITQRKQAEVALQESQLQLQRQLAEIETIYQSAPIGLNVLDTEFRFVRINQRLAEMNGLPVEAHLGRSIREVLPELAEATEQLLRPILETGEPLWNVEINGETPAEPGVQRTWLESFLPLKDGDRVIGISTVCEEITDRKRNEAERQQAEAALKQTKEELEIRVMERTAELQEANDRLQQELLQREQIEQQLRQSEARYRGMVEDQTELIVRFTADSTVLFANDAYCRYFNIQRADIIGKSYIPVIYEPDRERVAQCIRSITPNNPMLTIENRVIDAQGKVRWTEWVNRMLFDAQGNMIEFQSVGRDITELKQAEQALRQSEERRRLALDLTHLSFWDWHIPTGELTWNDNQFILLGLSPELSTARYELWRNRVHPEDVQRVEQLFQQSIETHTDYEAEYRVIHPDQSVHWLLSRGRAIYDDQDQPLRSLGVALDISERKHIESSLQESNRRWRFLLDNVQLVVIELNIDGQVEYVNPFYLALSGYEATEVIGQYWFDSFLTPGQKKHVETVFREVLDHNLHMHHQNPILTKSGEERMISWSNTVLRDPAGQAIGTISIGEDITERNKVERMKAEFISVVSHELRTPLTSMQAALSLLSEKIIDPNSAEGEATIQIATEGTDRLVRLVNDILVLERLESGKVRLAKHLCPVDDLVDTAIAQMQEIARQSQITLEASACPFQVYADGDRVLQVLTNLLSNAIKFSPAGSTVRLTVEAIPRNHREENHSEENYPEENPENWLLFAIQDQGRGIPAEYLERIFDRFQQIDASDSREKGGTGLGLAICRSIIQQHGGDIWVTSTLGKGSIFYFTVPMGQSADQKP